jgi:flagellar biosynthesis anti-sigma factor FlgM
MKIHGSDSSIQFEAYARKLDGKQQPTPVEAVGLSKNTTDKVVLSPRAKEIQEATRSLQAVPDVDHEKVAAIRSQVVEGTYRVEGRQIAERMLRETMATDFFLGN